MASSKPIAAAVALLLLSPPSRSAAAAAAGEAAPSDVDPPSPGPGPPPPRPYPAYQECVSPPSRSLPYCDASLPIPDRVSSLVASLTFAEKISLLSPDPSVGGGINDCLAVTSAVPRVGLGRYMWLTETNSQANSACLAVSPGEATTNVGDAGTAPSHRCATAFPGALGLAASFNRTMWRGKGDVISTEMRALNNAGGTRTFGPDSMVGLTGFGPNINVARDPRFGRTSELPGEDPYLNGEYAAHYLKGMQQVDAAGYVKMLAFAKHYTAYSRETSRGFDTYDISPHDLFDTYLPQYEAAMTTGRAAGVMCSYNGVNGRPACANGLLLNDVLREKWDAPDAIVMADCGAVSNLLGPPARAPSREHAAAWAAGNGTDVEAGTHLFRDYLGGAVRDGLISEEDAADASLRRIVTAHMRTGRFDPGAASWTSIPPDAIGSDAHGAARDAAARQSAVLLRNGGGALPLRPGSDVLLVGPQGDSGYGMLPDYFGDMVCPPSAPASDAATPSSSQGDAAAAAAADGDENDGGDNEDDGPYDCIPTFLDGLRRYNGSSGSVRYVCGVDEKSLHRYRSYDEALDAVRSDGVDVVVLAMGISRRTEYETVDRTETSLPGLQNEFAKDVLAAAAERDVAAVLLLTNGGALSVDDLLPPRDFSTAYDAGSFSAAAGGGGGRAELPPCYRSRVTTGEGSPPPRFPDRYAVVEAYNPSLGAPSVIAALYGDGPVQWGRMVATMYPAAWAEAHRMDQYDMAADGGRTYRYHSGNDLLAVFGEGMPSERPGDLRISCTMEESREGGAGDGAPARSGGVQGVRGLEEGGAGGGGSNGGGGGGAGAGTGGVRTSWTVTCAAANLDPARPASALAMAYVRPSDDVRSRVGTRFPVPLRSLRAFERVEVPPAAAPPAAPGRGGGAAAPGRADVRLTVSDADLLLVNEDGRREAVPGTYHLDVWDGWDGFASYDVELATGGDGTVVWS